MRAPMSRKATGPGTIRGLLCRSRDLSGSNDPFLVEAIVQADGDRLDVGGVGDGAERSACNRRTTYKARTAVGDISSDAKDQIFRLHAPMHIDAVFDIAARSPASQRLSGRRIDKYSGVEGGVGKDHASAVSHRGAAALHVEHRMTVDRADTRGEGVIPIAQFCRGYLCPHGGDGSIDVSRAFQMKVSKVVFQSQQRVGGR